MNGFNDDNDESVLTFASVSKGVFSQIAPASLERRTPDGKFLYVKSDIAIPGHNIAYYKSVRPAVENPLMRSPQEAMSFASRVCAAVVNDEESQSNGAGKRHAAQPLGIMQKLNGYTAEQYRAALLMPLSEADIYNGVLNSTFERQMLTYMQYQEEAIDKPIRITPDNGLADSNQIRERVNHRDLLNNVMHVGRKVLSSY